MRHLDSLLVAISVAIVPFTDSLRATFSQPASPERGTTVGERCAQTPAYLSWAECMR